MIKTKILVLLTSLITFGFYLAGKHAVGLGFCAENDYGCRADFNSFEGIMSFAKAFVFVSIFSLFLNYVYYRSWWIFARIALPIAAISLMLIGTGILHESRANGSGLGWVGILDNFFDVVATIIIYGLFVIGSAITIYRTQQRSKKLNAKK